ncbi:MAG TPA: Hpt domain-containing protein [Tepidisphaeraceae bacterium]|jgi:two-component system sensor histidine kinase and response regulator WspE
MGASDTPQIDPAMLELFQAEMDAHIPVLNEGLLALEKGQAAAHQIEGMMRAAHSIKGAARIVGIEPAVRVSHVMEDCFSAAKDGRITLTSDAVDVLLVGVDALQRICAPLAGAPFADAALEDLLSRLTAVKSGESGVAPTAAGLAARASIRGATDVVTGSVQPEEPSVALPAVFDDASIESLRKELVDALAQGPARVKLDFAQVGELSARALALLVSFAGEIGQAPAAPAIESRRMSPAVRTVLRVAGLDAAFGIGR